MTGNTHIWVAYFDCLVGGAHRIEDYVEKVKFTLDPSFVGSKEVWVEEAPFKLLRMGYGTFELPIEVHFKRETGVLEPVTIMH